MSTHRMRVAQDGLRSAAEWARRPYEPNANNLGLLKIRRTDATLFDSSESIHDTKLGNAALKVAGPAAIITAGASLAVAFAKARNINLDQATISSLLSSDIYLRVGLAATGVLGAVFGYGLRKALPDSISYNIEAHAFTWSSLALTVAAIFPPPSVIHEPAAGTFFVGASATLMAIGANLISHGRRAFGAFTLLTSTVALSAVGYGFIKNRDVPAKEELISSAALGAWMGIATLVARSKNKSNSSSATVN